LPTKGAKFAALKTEIADVDRRIGRAEALAAAERAAPAIIDRHGDGAFEERAREFSLRKAIIATLPADLGGGIDAGFEREISQEVVRRSGRPFQGLAVPDEVFMERRTLLAGSTAIELIPPVHLVRPRRYEAFARGFRISGSWAACPAGLRRADELVTAHLRPVGRAALCGCSIDHLGLASHRRR